VLIRAQGTDADADILGVALAFRGPTGALLDIYGDGEATLEGDSFPVLFAPRVTTAAFDGRATVRGTEVNLAGYLRSVGASAVVMRAFDRGYATSPPIEVPIEDATVGFGEACGPERICRTPMVCSSGGLCVLTGAAAAVCDGATVVPIAPPTEGVLTTATISGTTGAGYGQFEQSCAPGAASAGAERAYAVTIPAGVTADLSATTDMPGTGSTDTILALRRTCGDSSTELACNDDLPGSTRSAIEVRGLEAGTYYLMVELYGGTGSGSAPHELRVTLRPVLAAGETCDPAGIQNRCVVGTCDATALTCPGA
jgi:hypothetical protein